MSVCIDIDGLNINEGENGRSSYVLRENVEANQAKLNLENHSLTYRFKFTEEFMKELYTFSKIHQYDDRKDFKNAWSIWSEENQELIESEKHRLISLGYEGNILDKMFKSSRYYFRNKVVEKQKESTKRRKYISVTRELLDSMDQHINNNRCNADYKPQTGFISFCNENVDVLRKSISKICEEGTKDPLIIHEKIKKTYKNRYFVIVKK